MDAKDEKRQEVKKRLEQKKFLFQMKKEIDSLESELKHSNLVNAKINTIKNLKISARAMQAAAPYLLTAGLVFGVFTFFGDIPFYSGDEWNIYASVMTEFDNTGNIRKEKQYDDFKDDSGNKLDNDSSILYFYSKWQKGKDDLYSRTVQTYFIEKKTYEDVIKLFEQENLKLEEVLGTPNSDIKETRNNLSDEELEEESYIKAVIYNKDENDYIVHKETVSENIIFSIIYVLATVLAELAPLYFRSEISSFDFLDCVEEIKRKHQPLDIETIKKKLELKKDNYDRMMR